MKSPIYSKMALVDIGAAGPIGGFIIAVLSSIIGLHYSTVIELKEVSENLSLGDSMLFSLLSRIIVGEVPAGHDVLLHPVAFAGWIGFFVTSLNLIPVGQLDGGHIAFAILGRRHRTISIALIAGLTIMGAVFWVGWIVWAALMLILRIDHPPIINEDVPLDIRRRIVSILCLCIFVLTFTPVPFSLAI